MKTSPLLLLVVGVAAMVAIPVSLIALPIEGSHSAPALIPTCASLPLSLYPNSVPAGQDTNVGSTSGGGSRLTILSESTAVHDVFLLTQDQYDAFTSANGTGFNGSVLHGPPSVYFWSSGEVTSTNHTFLMGNGTWFILVYNPGSAAITVDLEVVSCNAP